MSDKEKQISFADVIARANFVPLLSSKVSSERPIPLMDLNVYKSLNHPAQLLKIKRSVVTLNRFFTNLHWLNRFSP